MNSKNNARYKEYLKTVIKWSWFKINDNPKNTYTSPIPSPLVNFEKIYNPRQINVLIKQIGIG